MFVELMPLLAGRTVMITVAREDDKTLRVNVLPTKSGDSENPALATPLSYTGTPEELDAELGRELAGYVECHRALGSTLAAAKAEMEAAAKAAQEEARKKAEERKKKAEKPTDKPADPVPSTVPTAPTPPATASLFGDSQPAAS
jgi:PRTRC genetic system protein E